MFLIYLFIIVIFFRHPVGSLENGPLGPKKTFANEGKKPRGRDHDTWRTLEMLFNQM